jgi:hypothetical protein
MKTTETLYKLKMFSLTWPAYLPWADKNKCLLCSWSKTGLLNIPKSAKVGEAKTLRLNSEQNLVIR